MPSFAVFLFYNVAKQHPPSVELTTTSKNSHEEIEKLKFTAILIGFQPHQSHFGVPIDQNREEPNWLCWSGRCPTCHHLYLYLPYIIWRYAAALVTALSAWHRDSIVESIVDDFHSVEEAVVDYGRKLLQSDNFSFRSLVTWRILDGMSLGWWLGDSTTRLFNDGNITWSFKRGR